MIRLSSFLFLFLAFLVSLNAHALNRITEVKIPDFNSCIPVGTVVADNVYCANVTHRGFTGWAITKSSRSKFKAAYPNFDAVHAGIAHVASFSQGASCPDGTEFNETSGICEQNKCKELQQSGDVVELTWLRDVWGDNMTGAYWCKAGVQCVAQIETHVGCHEDRCFGDAPYTGDKCENPETEGVMCSDSTCSTARPEPEKPPTPEPEPDPDTEHKPTDPTKPIPDPNPLPPIDVKPPPPEVVDPEPEVPEPELTPDSNGDVVKAVTNLNRDVNKALNDLNIDINKANAEQNGELMLLNANVKQNSEHLAKLREENIDIYDNTKALIQNLNKDVTSAVNRNTERIDGELERVGEKLDGIGTTLDQMTNVDTSGAGVSATCIETDTCVSYYETKYPEGLSGMASTQLAELKAEVIDGFVASFGELDLSNAQEPKFGLPVPFYGWMYFSDYIDMNWIFSFIRVCFMVTTVFMCRRIVFGG
ncbi:adsorption protein [Vibrio scophthalmi]|uniref:adsorption protein n=1 Tax=Vibrio scophthalmi TaxID=45658 RepID=UPI003EBBDB6D